MSDHLAWPPCQGRTLILILVLTLTFTPLKVAELAEMMVDHEVTFTGGVPTIFAGLQEVFATRLLQYQQQIKIDRIVIGGSAPPPTMMRWYKQHFGCDFYNAWGMTESVSGTCARRVATRADLSLSLEAQFEQNVAVTPGFALPHLEFRIVHPDNFDAKVPQDGQSVGELMIRGPTVTGRYFREPEGASKFHQGWLATGDICKVTPEGRVHLVDRSKDLIKSGGVDPPLLP